MIFNELNIDVKDYLGRIGPGVTVILSIVFESKVYEGIYWYTDDINLLQIPEEIESVIGSIEEYNEYENIMDHLKNTNPSYFEIATELEDLLDTTPPTDP